MMSSSFKSASVASNLSFGELSCMDSGVESTIFRLCLLSSMFIDFHALPSRPGKTEKDLLHMAFAMRSNVFLDVFLTFIQHVWAEPEQFFVSRRTFIEKMSQYPLSHFLQTTTFRSMIALRMPETAAALKKSKERVAK